MPSSALPLDLRAPGAKGIVGGRGRVRVPARATGVEGPRHARLRFYRFGHGLGQALGPNVPDAKEEEGVAEPPAGRQGGAEGAGQEGRLPLEPVDRGGDGQPAPPSGCQAPKTPRLCGRRRKVYGLVAQPVQSRQD